MLLPEQVSMHCKQDGGDGRIETHQTPYFILCTDEVRQKLSLLLPTGQQKTININWTKFSAGTEITAYAYPDEGYRFKEWQDEAGDVVLQIIHIPSR